MSFIKARQHSDLYTKGENKMKAHINTEDVEYTLDNIKAIHFEKGELFIIFSDNDGVFSTEYSASSLGNNGSVTIS